MSQIIFVDPQDPLEKYWWSAITVPPSDYDHFFNEMGETITIEKDSVLVCYFEDASYSSVKKEDILVYDENDSKVSTMLLDKKFAKCRAIKSMLNYINEGKIPTKFKWLKKGKRKYRKKNQSEGVFKKKVWLERASKVFKDS